MIVIDSHIHCGIQNVNLPFEAIEPLLSNAGIEGACLFAPVEDIYDRYNEHFQDSPSWIRTRHAANRYVLDLASRKTRVFPYLFVWNDFAIDELHEPFCGIKWHRHSNEPVYSYNDSRCAGILREIVERRLPIVLEESFENTLRFVFSLAPEAVIIIPHLGMLNGSYGVLERAGVWHRDNTYADTPLASTSDMRHFLQHYGPDRLLFGSDFPFGDPAGELERVRTLGLADVDLARVLGGNILRLIGEVKSVCHQT
jgi:hypothetical protein